VLVVHSTIVITSSDVISLHWPQSNALDSAIVIIWLMLSVYIGLTVVLVSSAFHYRYHSIDVISVY
jgi:hypothetical protein